MTRAARIWCFRPDHLRDRSSTPRWRSRRKISGKKISDADDQHLHHMLAIAWGAGASWPCMRSALRSRCWRPAEEGATSDTLSSSSLLPSSVSPVSRSPAATPSSGKCSVPSRKVRPVRRTSQPCPARLKLRSCRPMSRRAAHLGQGNRRCPRSPEAAREEPEPRFWWRSSFAGRTLGHGSVPSRFGAPHRLNRHAASPL